MSNDDDERIEFDEIEEHHGNKAYLVTIGSEKYWLPKSQVRVYEIKKALYAPVWLLEKKGLI